MTDSLEEIAAEIRRRIVNYSAATKTPHLGSCLSCVDILTVLYFDLLRIDPKQPKAPDRDRLILSKGHAAPALFQFLAMKGFFPYEDLLNSDHHNGGLFGEHPPTPDHLAGIEAATGSLGHGMPMGVGMALAARIKQTPYKVYAVLGDGECNEGSIWEAAMFAAAQKLDNMTIIVDYNKWQATGRTQEVLEIEPLADKWGSFGWDVCEVDGHNIAALQGALKAQTKGKPKAIIAHTVKGKGVSFMEDDNNWHYRTPNSEELAAAMLQLDR